MYIPNVKASHSSDRAKRRRSLTKLSMNELGVEDIRPWAQVNIQKNYLFIPTNLILKIKIA